MVCLPPPGLSWGYRASGDIIVVLDPLGETFGREDIEATWSET
ncbi:MAG: hypothetical protein AAF074_15990 [Pseudomonadota bacterium]